MLQIAILCLRASVDLRAPRLSRIGANVINSSLSTIVSISSLAVSLYAIDSHKGTFIAFVNVRGALASIETLRADVSVGRSLRLAEGLVVGRRRRRCGARSGCGALFEIHM